MFFPNSPKGVKRRHNAPIDAFQQAEIFKDVPDHIDRSIDRSKSLDRLIDRSTS
jgi:hypothetical protein